ncbi:iron ABC transporter permease [Ignisphaera sp. 4213-co]|uniref:Iron ABC transporter permease n=1 Tax=Ignisphaera cupida TaxID=3050454 RepID=A0ABD4Z685_9CREN|nr:iron ABC transporter permease [Ignisphaera sp. 4213-co]MDK6028629.1 iron ABC transporter permease [Ignisphaera sp. 4213-co]
MYIERIFKERLFFIILSIIILIVLIPISISIGVYKITFIDVIKYIFFQNNMPPDIRDILLFRLRRVLASIAIGFILGGSGAAMQSILRNPMASPFTLGISNAAALGVALALLAGVGGSISRWVILYNNPYVLPIFAFVFAVIQTSIVLLLASRAGLSEKALILAAIAMNFFYQALLSLVQYLLLNELQIALIVFWTFGDVGRVGWVELRILAIGAAIISGYFIAKSIDYDLMVLGDDVAYASGVDAKRVRLETSIVAALGASITTAFSGVIAFLCLVSPHIARLIVGNSHRYLIVQSMLVAAILLIVADAIGRFVLSPIVLPVGITLSLIGSPLLIYLLLRR